MTIWFRRRFAPLLLIWSAFILLAACGSAPQRALVTGPSAHGPVAAERLIRLSREQLGTPYRYGGSSPTEGFDCSGLVHYVHARNGLYVPRSARDQFRASKAVPLNAIRPGDLLFFRISGNKPSHVGIYAGHGSFIHAPSSNKNVSQAYLSNPYWRKRLIGAGRFI